MDRLQNSSSQIGQIIGVIDEIAFQTNLLALNAGVEAARAGEAGKGFAVVAQEVRELAQRSAAAAKEIKSLVTASGAEVASGVALVNETGDALRTIETEINKINESIQAIVLSSDEQSRGLQEINSAIKPDGSGHPTERRHGRRDQCGLPGAHGPEPETARGGEPLQVRRPAFLHRAGGNREHQA
jgi:hypothetical protein